MVEVVYEWARGMSFNRITDLTDVMEGTIVRVITRLDETCREVKNAARIIGDPTLFQKMGTCQELIKRYVRVFFCRNFVPSSTGQGSRVVMWIVLVFVLTGTLKQGHLQLRQSVPLIGIPSLHDRQGVERESALGNLDAWAVMGLAGRFMLLFWRKLRSWLRQGTFLPPSPLPHAQVCWEASTGNKPPITKDL